MAPLRVAIVGLGHNGQSWVAAYNNCEMTQVVGLCDFSPERRAEARGQAPDAGLYDDLAQMLEIERPDILSVHTPDHLHAEPFVMGLEAGCHVMVEKPAGNSISDLEKMITAAQDSDRKTMVGQVLRFNPMFAHLHKLVTEGVFGEIFYLEADYIHNLHYQASEDRFNPHLGGENWYLSREIPIVGGGVHPLDLLRWYAGSPVVETFGYGNNIAFPQMKNPDCMVAIFRFASGPCARITALYGPVGEMAPFYNMGIYGTRATFKQGKLVIEHGHGMEVTDLSEMSGTGHPYQPEVEHFADCIINQKSPLVDIFEGARSAAAVILAAEAIRTGQTQQIPQW